MALETRQERVAHLLRRAAFAATPALLARYQNAALSEVVDDLLQGGDPAEPAEPAAALPQLQGKPLDLTTLPGAQLWWLQRMATTANPLRERMTLYWHGHFTSAISKARLPQLMVDQNVTLRRQALGRFEEILYALSIDPAMLIWLDGRSSHKGSPNENYAREVMELFALGIGHYSEQDVQEGARAFTGWSVSRDGEPVYRDRLHDHTAKTYLGVTGDLGYQEMARILARDPDCAAYVATKLWSALAYPNPDPATVAPVAAAFRDSAGSIAAVLRAIFTSDAFYSDAAVGALVRTPAELVVAVCRLTEISPVDPLVLQSMRAMGQELYNPPNVAGWPPGLAWLGSGGLVARMNFGRWVASQVVKGGTPRAATGDLLGYWSQRLDLDGRLSANTRAALAAYRPSPGNPGDLTRQTAALVQALVACPETQIL